MPHGQNTVHVTYRLLDGARRVRLSLRPIVGFRPHEAPVDRSPVDGYTVSVRGQRIEVAADEQRPALRLVLHAPTGGFSLDDQAIHDVRYLVEERRGYDFAGPLWSPGRFRTDLLQGTPVTVIASAEPWDMLAAVNPEAPARWSAPAGHACSAWRVQPYGAASAPNSSSRPTSSS